MDIGVQVRKGRAAGVPLQWPEVPFPPAPLHMERNTNQLLRLTGDDGRSSSPRSYNKKKVPSMRSNKLPIPFFHTPSESQILFL